MISHLRRTLSITGGPVKEAAALALRQALIKGSTDHLCHMHCESYTNRLFNWRESQHLPFKDTTRSAATPECALTEQCLEIRTEEEATFVVRYAYPSQRPFQVVLRLPGVQPDNLRDRPNSITPSNSGRHEAPLYVWIRQRPAG